MPSRNTRNWSCFQANARCPKFLASVPPVGCAGCFTGPRAGWRVSCVAGCSSRFRFKSRLLRSRPDFLNPLAERCSVEEHVLRWSDDGRHERRHSACPPLPCSKVGGPPRTRSGRTSAAPRGHKLFHPHAVVGKRGAAMDRPPNHSFDTVRRQPDIFAAISILSLDLDFG